MNSTPSTTIELLQRNNTGRDPERLALKYAKMAKHPFTFLRGTCHLFYDNLPDTPALRHAPLAWCCGDLHFENFGSYKADNRQVYFDMNDFDEAALAPATWDIARLLTSIQCGADALNASRAEALVASSRCLSAYREALTKGKPLWVERETSTGLVNELLDSLRERERMEFLDKRSMRKGRNRQLKVDGEKALSVTDAQRDAVTRFMDDYASKQSNPEFFRVIDVARRIAGTGSLGVERYVVLVEGKGSPDNNYLLDIKEAKPSALVPHLKQMGVTQPIWQDEATRVVTIQKRMQCVDHAFLEPVLLNGLSCLLRGLQPSEDRVAIGTWGKHLVRLEEVTATMGRILAWDQLRSAGRDGSACADDLIEFSQYTEWESEIMEVAATMVNTTQTQWQQFVEWFSAMK